MTESTEDGDAVDEQLERLLGEAREALADLDEDASPPAELRDVADEVNDLVADGDTAALLEATDADLPDEADPETVPDAIARSDSGSVIELRVLLLLSKLSEQWDEAGGDEVLDDLRELIRELSSREGAAEADGTDGSNGDGDPDESDGESSESEELTATSGDRFESELTGAIGDFREAVETMSEEVREREEGREREAESEPTADASERATEADGRTGRGGGGSTLSTLPPSDRADMRFPRRLSTLRTSSEQREE